jgi:hypothetical protein
VAATINGVTTMKLHDLESIYARADERDRESILTIARTRSEAVYDLHDIFGWQGERRAERRAREAREVAQ